MPQIVKKARGFGVTLALENTWEDRPEVLAHLLGMLPRDEVGVCLDTGHLNAFSSLPVARWWNCVGDRIVALHLHDNDGISDDHLAPGRGTFDFGTLAGFLEGLDPFPLIDLEVDHAHALEGRRYLEGIFGVSG
jgi:sugar phosphate isomerase/epimerase